MTMTTHKGKEPPSSGRDRPFPQSYWVREGRICAGHYPGSLDPAERLSKLNGLLDCGIRRFLNLIPEGESSRGGRPFDPYEPLILDLARQRGVEVECLRLGFPDAGIPTIERMKAILDVLDDSERSERPLYVHCWGGHGRTSTVVACHLIRRGGDWQTAEAQILAWRENLPRNWYPFEGAQARFAQQWRNGE